MESYHVNIPSESDKEARVRFFHELAKRIVISFFFLKTKAATISNIAPAEIMLMAESIIGETRRNEVEVVKYSMMMDSIEIVIA